MPTINQLIANPRAIQKARKKVPALQVIYPDVHGVWPWQPGSRIADVPVLGIVPDLGVDPRADR